MTQGCECGADIGKGGAVGTGRGCRRAPVFGDRGQGLVQFVQQPRIVCGLAAGPGLGGRIRPGCGLLSGCSRTGGRGGPVSGRSSLRWCRGGGECWWHGVLLYQWCGARRVAGAIDAAGAWCGGAACPGRSCWAGVRACRSGWRLPVRGGERRAVARAVVLSAGVIPARVLLCGGGSAEERAE